MAMDKNQLNALLSGKTPEQKKVIKYFNQIGGCLSKPMTDAEYDAMVAQQLNSINFRARALDKIGLDESEVNEIAPVNFHGYVYKGNVYALLGKDNKWRSSAYQVSWIFFSATQVYFYQYTFNMDEGSKKETTEEYFYKDITNFSATNESIEKRIPKSSCTGAVTYSNIMKEYDEFTIVVPGDKMYCSLTKTDTTEDSIKGMKALLREKKNNG